MSDDTIDSTPVSTEAYQDQDIFPRQPDPRGTTSASEISSSSNIPSRSSIYNWIQSPPLLQHPGFGIPLRNWFTVPRNLIICGMIIAIILGIVVVIHQMSSHTRKDDRSMNCAISLVVSDEGGPGVYSSISQALDATKRYSPFRVSIKIAKGEYHEKVHILHSRTNLTLIGAGADKTVITSNGSGSGPNATMWVLGRGFVSRDLAIKSTAIDGMAVDNWAEQSIFYRYNIDGPGRLLNLRGRRAQYYKNCSFHGGNMSVQGDAHAYFESCKFEVEGENEKLVFVGQTSDIPFPLSRIGFIFHMCSFCIVIKGELSTPKSFLGSMLGPYAYITVMESYLDDSMTGYLLDMSPPNTTYLGIFRNSGPPALGSGVYPLVLHELTKVEAYNTFSLGQQFEFNGSSWIPQEIS